MIVGWEWGVLGLELTRSDTTLIGGNGEIGLNRLDRKRDEQ